MFKVPVALLIAGLCFTFFSLTMMGVDLLIDAVGFLFIFNGLLHLRRKWTGFWAGPLCSILLVGISSLQLFLPAWTLVGVLRLVLTSILYLVCARGFFQMLRPCSLFEARALAALFGLQAAALLLVFVSKTGALAVGIQLGLQIALLILLFYTCFLSKKADLQ